MQIDVAWDLTYNEISFMSEMGETMRVDEVMTEIIQRCRLYGAQKIILYGSRAKGTATERSDIDIAVSGVASHEILDLQENLEEIPTLYTIDLVDLDTCQNQLLLEDIKQYGREIIRRFESFRNSLDSLAEAKQRDLSDSFVLSGTSAKFSITFDLAWKVMKDILVQYYAITGFVTGSPREVLRESFQANLITGDEWMDMLKVRNQLAHDYDGVIVKEHCGTIVHVYIDKLYDFKKAVEKLLKE